MLFDSGWDLISWDLVSCVLSPHFVHPDDYPFCCWPDRYFNCACLGYFLRGMLMLARVVCCMSDTSGMQGIVGDEAEQDSDGVVTHSPTNCQLICACAHTHTHTHTHAHTSTRTHAHTRTHTHKQTQTHTQTRAHTHTHTHTHHTHTHTHTHTLAAEYS